MAAAEGRVKQKERTRQALLAATRALFREGTSPTVASVAARANVSEPTAYRYYSDVRSLVQDALLDHWPGLDEALVQLRNIPFAPDRAQYAAEEMTRIVLENEAQVRSLIALDYSASEHNSVNGRGETRPAYRFLLIDAVIESIGDGTKKSQLMLVRQSLAAVIGAEAVFSLKDAAQMAPDEIRTVLGWSARCLTVSALQ